MLPKEVIAKIRRLEIKTGRIVNELFGGQYESVFKGRGMEFDEVREYQPGDDIRSIDWNVTARMGHPYIKKFVEERELNIMLLVDASNSQKFGTQKQTKMEMAAELSGVLAYTAIKNNDRVGALLFTDKVEKFIPPAKGSTHLSRILRDVLYAHPESKGTDLNPPLEFINDVLKRKCIVFLISDFHAQGYDRALAITNRRHDVIAFEIIDQGEQKLPPVGFIAMEDLESNKSRLVWAGSKNVREAFRLGYENSRVQKRSFFRRLGVDHIELYTDKSYVEPLLNFFRMRARRFR
ncbi:MAG: DUF58 domain-containing protein [Candidatus Firestonebacteria bacterium]|nr:DUF58 domain-containing protein [Candidatus Firestonebacteria bacterium]